MKLIITDLDRTLLRRDKTISDFTAEVLRRCREKGILVAYATLRPANAIKRVKAAAMPDFVIADGGAEIWHGEQLIFRNPIQKEVAAELLRALLSNEDIKEISVTAAEGTFTNYNGEPWDAGWEFIHTDFSDGKEYDATKLSVEFARMEAVMEIMRSFPQLKLVANSGEPWCQMLKSECAKEIAAQVLCEKLGISAREVTAFGDDFSDMELIRWSGTGVAVDNAIDEVKAVADYICGSNDSDGVAMWIDEHLL